MNKQVVVGVDGSVNSVAALRWAGAYARLTGATVHAISTWEYPAFPDTSGIVTMPGRDFLIGGAQAVLDTALAQAQLPADVEVVGEPIEGSPAHTLLDRSADAELLVVGRRGHSGIVGIITGSVATSCAHHARVPVVIVPLTSD